MTKKLLQLSVVAFTLIFILNACRTDETLNSEKRTQNEKISAFQKFENIHAQEIRNPKTYYSKNGDSTQLSYGEPFAEVIGNFLESHPNYAQRIENEIGEIDLNVVSQTFGEEEKALLFPIKDYSTGKVKAVWSGVINKDRDFVRFYYMLNNSVEVQTIIESFQKHYDNRSLSKEAEIEEVIIYVPIPIGSGLPWWWYDNNYDGAPSGGGVGSGMSGDGGLHGGGANGGNSSGMVMPPPPEVAISDIKKFLSCLNINQPANLTVYAQSMFGGNGVGHAFISITQGNNTMTFGFYPKYGYLSSFSGTGIMGDNGGHNFNISSTFSNISGSQLSEMIAISLVYASSDYDLQYNNCSDFALDILNVVGVSTNNSGSWDNPNTVAATLFRLQNNTSSGNALNTKRTCP